MNRRKRGEFASFLASSIWASPEYCYLESRSSLFDVHLAGKKCSKLEHYEQTIHVLKLFLFKALFDWVLALGSFSVCSVLDMIDICDLSKK